MQSPAFLSILTFPLVTSVVLLAYACATNAPETKQPAPTETAATTAPAAEAPDTEKKSPVPPTAVVKKELAALDKGGKPAAGKTAAPAKTAPAAESPKRVTKYVSALLLNVRSHPSSGAAIVGKLARGSMLPVTILGQWAKIGEGQFVLTKYLSEKPVSRRMASK